MALPETGTPSITLRMEASTLESISARRAEIGRERAALAAAEAELAREDQDLAAAQRVIARFATAASSPQRVGDVVSRIVSQTTVAQKVERGKRKPPGIPTIVHMARVVLAHAAAQGQSWMDAAQITDAIRARWQWPDIKTDYVTPQLWRAANRGVFVKDGASYALARPNEKGLAAQTVRPPQSNGAADSSSA